MPTPTNPPQQDQQDEFKIISSAYSLIRVRAKLSGPEARLGDVPAIDVARVIIGLERALARPTLL